MSVTKEVGPSKVNTAHPGLVGGSGPLSRGAVIPTLGLSLCLLSPDRVQAEQALGLPASAGKTEPHARAEAQGHRCSGSPAFPHAKHAASIDVKCWPYPD